MYFDRGQCGGVTERLKVSDSKSVGRSKRPMGSNPISPAIYQHPSRDIEKRLAICGFVLLRGRQVIVENFTSSISILTGVVSIAIAVIAMWISLRAERESRANYDRTKDVLAQIDTKAAVVETVVKENQQQLLNTITSLLVPNSETMDEKMGMAIVQAFAQNPQGMGPLLQQIQAMGNQDNRS